MRLLQAMSKLLAADDPRIQDALVVVATEVEKLQRAVTIHGVHIDALREVNSRLVNSNLELREKLLAKTPEGLKGEL
jgi:hypothetical protein